MKQGSLSRVVVIKVLRRDRTEDPDLVGRTKDEALLLSRLQHDNIVRVEQLIELHGRPALVMEHIQGLTLQEILRANGPMPVGVAMTVVGRVAAALDAAYNVIPPGETQPLQVIHRDLKPSNIMLSTTGTVKVLDFGTARAEMPERQAQSLLLRIGSPQYMAPECHDFAGTRGPAVDVFALGCTLYELCTGTPLGPLSPKPEAHAATLRERLPALLELTPDPEAGAEILRIVRETTRYQPTDRPRARDLQEATRSWARLFPSLVTPLDQFAEAVVAPIYRRRTPKLLHAADSLAPSPPTPAPQAKAPAPQAETGVTVMQRERAWEDAHTEMAKSALVEVAPGHGRLTSLTLPPDTLPPAPPPPSARPRQSSARWLGALMALMIAVGFLVGRPVMRARKVASAREPAPQLEAVSTTEPPTEPDAHAQVEPPAPAPVEPGPEKPDPKRTLPRQVPAVAPTPTVRAVRVDSEPAGATLRIAGNHYTLPATVPLAPGPLQATLLPPEGEPLECTLEVTADLTTLQFDLNDGLRRCPSSP